MACRGQPSPVAPAVEFPVTAPNCLDPASDVVTAFVNALRQHFDPASDCPPVGGGSAEVRLIVGDDGSPAVAWEERSDCKAPFLWVRVCRRFRSRTGAFPRAFEGARVCDAKDVFNVLEVEVGVARCVSTKLPASKQVRADEAEYSLDDSWRIERTLWVATCRLGRDDKRLVATDTVEVFGPEGGLTAWTGRAFVEIGD